jgi:pilus assembly protein Flp/PilA
MIDRIRKWIRHYDHDGQGLVEYGLILGLITIVCIAALSASGNQVNGIIQKVASSLSSVS